MGPSMFRNLLVLALFCAQFATAQDTLSKKTPSVTMSPVPLTTVTRGKPNLVYLRFRVDSPFHINSNTPKLEFLIPTALTLDAPTDIAVGRITYPTGEEKSFPFAPNEKLSVYSGTFILSVMIRPLVGVLPGKYAFHGQLKYQACDNASCYPPKRLPVDFTVKVVKEPPAPHKNPAQSPHAHR